MYELWNINSIPWSGWYITIKLWNIYNDKIEVVSFVQKSSSKLTIGVIFEINVKKWDKGNYYVVSFYFQVKKAIFEIYDECKFTKNYRCRKKWPRMYIWTDDLIATSTKKKKKNGRWWIFSGNGPPRTTLSSYSSRTVNLPFSSTQKSPICVQSYRRVM